MPPGETETWDIQACCESLPEHEAIDIELTCTGGEWEEPENNPDNCGEPVQINWSSPEEDGEYTITIKYTWSDSGTCSKSCVVTVEEEGNGNGEEE